VLHRLHTIELDAPPTGVVVPFLVHARSDDDAPLASGGPSRGELLSNDELLVIEATYADGITAAQIVEVFTSRGIRFSEASFRKYVQQNLLPRSRRVGRKGKNRGSLGVYPAKTVRRINAVKQWMASGYTIEEIQGQFLLYTDLVETIAESLAELRERLAADATALPTEDRKAIERALADLAKDEARLVARLDELARRVTTPRTDQIRLAGAAGGAEDLL